MNSLYFDCYSGVAGDMILAALLDLDLDRDRWLKTLRGLAVKGFDVKFRQATRQGFQALRVEIKVNEPQPERHLEDIEKIIAGSRLSTEVKGKALKIFTCLAEAEAKVHGRSVEKIHFHEVGAVDAIVDVVGTCLALESLGVDEIYSSPVGVGRGLSKSAHGPMPLPPPATLEILRDCPMHFHQVDTELATPTGAAILKSLAVFESPAGPSTLVRIGYGAGSKTIPELVNVLRAVLLQRDSDLEADQAVLLETNIDDMNPEIYPHVIEKLLGHGAMDAYLTPITMKKGRPGVVLSALCPPERRSELVDVIYQETSTLGIRISRVDRLKLPRREIKVKTPWGVVRGKEARWKGKIRRTPEFEDCRRLSQEKNVPLQDIYQAFYSASKSPRKRS